MQIGILYPGDLGSALGRAVREAGGTPITCLDGRSAATRSRAAVSEFSVTPSLNDLARRADIVVSLVPPRFALEMAQKFARSVSSARCSKLPVYLDGNSVSPQRKRQIADILARAGLPCVDGAFFGPAGQVGSQNLLALSGPGAKLASPFFRQFVEVQVMGRRIGPPAALKMAIGILTKALCALFLEMVCASGNESQLDAILDLMRRFYPGTMRFVERSLPTYPTHVARKADELDEVHRWLNELRVRGDMTRSAGFVLRRLEHAGLEQRKHWKFDELVREIVRRDILRSLPERSRERAAISRVPAHTTM